MTKLFTRNKARLAFLLLAAMMALAACSTGGGAGQTSEGGQKDTLEGTAQSVLADVVSSAEEQSESPMGAASEQGINSENAQYMLGLTAEEFGEYVEDAAASTAMISTQAHEAALVKCKSFEAAATVKNLIAAGFDSGKWICVRPEVSLVVDSGSYVFLVSSQAGRADGLVKSFTAKAGDNVGETVTFYAGESGGMESGEGGGDAVTFGNGEGSLTFENVQ